MSVHIPVASRNRNTPESCLSWQQLYISRSRLSWQQLDIPRSCPDRDNYLDIPRPYLSSTTWHARFTRPSNLT